MKLDLRRVQHVVAVARLLSFSRAADELGISQPALSRSIASLEEDFGVRIFDRGRSGVVITPVGAALIADAERLLSQARTIEHNLAQWSRAEAGAITFGMGPMAASILLPRLLARVAVSHPALAVTADVRSPPDLIADLEADRTEFCICADVAVPPADHLALEMLAAVPAGLFVRADHPLASRGSLGAEDLAGFPAASGNFNASAPGERGLAAICTPTIISENYHILKEVMLTSDTIWLSCAQLLSQELADGSAVRLDVRAVGSDPEIRMAVVSLAHRTPTPSARLLLGILRELADICSRVPSLGARPDLDGGCSD